MFKGEAHRERHAILHKMLDELLADFALHTGLPVLSRTIGELLKWSYEQTIQPTEAESDDA